MPGGAQTPEGSSEGKATAAAGSVPQKHGTATGTIKVLACLFLIAAGLKVASDLLVTIALAAFLAMVCSRPIGWFKSKGLSTGLAIGVVLVLLVGAFVLTTVFVGGSAAQFTAALPRYQSNFEVILDGLGSTLDRFGIQLNFEQVKEALDSKRLLTLASGVIGGVVGTVSNVFMILLLVAFMLADAQTLPARLRKALGGPDADLSRFHEVSESVNTYLWVKTWISLLTGACIGIFAAIIGLDFPLLWGFLAFVFNYIPNIGSLIAAVPAVLLALLQGGWNLALLTGVGFLVVNNVIGNVVEPRVLGKKMGMSPLVVFLSLLVWSWLWGPMGMLLSVPLTMVIKIGLESTPDGRGIAALLGGDESDA